MSTYLIIYYVGIHICLQLNVSVNLIFVIVKTDLTNFYCKTLFVLHSIDLELLILNLSLLTPLFRQSVNSHYHTIFLSPLFTLVLYYIFRHVKVTKVTSLYYLPFRSFCDKKVVDLKF